MRIKTAWVVLFVFALLLPTLSAGQDQASAGPPDPGTMARSAWESLKKLPGEWEGQAEGNRATVVYRLTGAGSALMETMLPGTEHEMVSMYHMDGPDLVMTHYCAAGNQPHLKLDLKDSKPGRFAFSFVRGSNMDVSKDGHIHSLLIRIIDSDHIECDWGSYKDGKPQPTTKFALTRKK